MKPLVGAILIDYNRWRRCPPTVLRLSIWRSLKSAPERIIPPDRLLEQMPAQIPQQPLMPHTSASLNGGMVRKNKAGRFLICPSDCDKGVRTMSPSFIRKIRFSDHVQRVLGFRVAVCRSQSLLREFSPGCVVVCVHQRFHGVHVFTLQANCVASTPSSHARRAAG